VCTLSKIIKLSLAKKYFTNNSQDHKLHGKKKKESKSKSKKEKDYEEAKVCKKETINFSIKTPLMGRFYFALKYSKISIL